MKVNFQMNIPKNKTKTKKIEKEEKNISPQKKKIEKRKVNKKRKINIEKGQQLFFFEEKEKKKKKTLKNVQRFIDQSVLTTENEK